MVRHGGHARHSNPVRHRRHVRTRTNQSEISESLEEMTQNLSFVKFSSFRKTKTKRTHNRGLPGTELELYAVTKTEAAIAASGTNPTCAVTWYKSNSVLGTVPKTCFGPTGAQNRARNRTLPVEMLRTSNRAKPKVRDSNLVVYRIKFKSGWSTHPH